MMLDVADAIAFQRWAVWSVAFGLVWIGMILVYEAIYAKRPSWCIGETPVDRSLVTGSMAIVAVVTRIVIGGA